MRILQQHLDFIEYEPIGKEISAAEEIPDKKKQRYEEIVALFVSVEPGDDDEVAKKAVEGTKAFLEKLKVKRIIIYPYAHLSSNLARPKDALEVLKTMERLAKEAGLETYRAPFGWNKAFQIKVKGHPLAEQSRVYSNAAPAVEARGGSRPREEASARADRGAALRPHKEERLRRPSGDGPQDNRREARPIQLPGAVARDGLLAQQGPEAEEPPHRVHARRAREGRLRRGQHPRPVQQRTLEGERPLGTTTSRTCS